MYKCSINDKYTYKGKIIIINKKVSKNIKKLKNDDIFY